MQNQQGMGHSHQNSSGSEQSGPLNLSLLLRWDAGVARRRPSRRKQFKHSRIYLFFMCWQMKSLAPGSELYESMTAPVRPANRAVSHSSSLPFPSSLGKRTAGRARLSWLWILDGALTNQRDADIPFGGLESFEGNEPFTLRLTYLFGCSPGCGMRLMGEMSWWVLRLLLSRA